MKYIVGNLKMNLINAQEREQYFKSFKKEISGKKFKNSQMVLCPPAVYLESFLENLKGKFVKIGSQNIFWEAKGSFTGEISPFMVKSLGCDFAIVGHSERRKYFGETNDNFNLKIKAAIKAGLKVIYCVGETKAEREVHVSKDVITDQLQEGLQDIKSQQLENLIITYEPAWSVGSDEVPTSNEIMEAKILIKKILAEKYGLKYAQKINILYGGSVAERFAKQVCIDPGMDGALVGRESLNPHEFVKIAQMLDNN
jgi:triosephosphate isomerase (TIM)